jgi:2-C-methyl-D-erythritol 4-phosphate cytidylyltransferase
VVPGSPRNIKITTTEVLALAAALLCAPEASSGNRLYPVAADD